MNFQLVKYFIVFLVLNFLALAIGGFATSDAVSGDWYQNINKAPWTPPGWAFGAAWSSLMLFFAVYMAFAWQTLENKKKLATLYLVQWILNVAWNPVFFIQHWVILGFVIIVGLILILGYFLFAYRNALKYKVLLAAPYFIWLLIAASLNLYIALFN